MTLQGATEDDFVRAWVRATEDGKVAGEGLW